MYLKISTLTPDEDFSFIIAKNPSSPPYERQLGGDSTKRVVRGIYTGDSSYEIVTYNDGVAFFNEMKARNEAAYVRPELWLVCPSNLRGMATALRSALHGDVGNELSPERFHAPKMLRAEVGPFPDDAWEEFFAALGLKSEELDEGTTEAKTLLLTTVEPMSVTEFLQKIFISMMIFTMKWSFSDKITEAQFNKYFELVKTWAVKVAQPYRDIMYKRLARYRGSLQKRFEALKEGLPEPEIEQEEDGNKKEDEQAREERLSLHEKRHLLILSHIPIGSKKIVDLGAGEGKLFAKLIQHFPQTTILGVDASRERVQRVRRKVIGRSDRALHKREGNTPENQVEIYHDNLLFPKNWSDLVGADTLIASEVIEHMRIGDRARFMRLIIELLEPRTILLTTPNVEANALWGMPEGMLRHDDHKIEYNRKQFEAEVVAPLSVHYDVTFLELTPGEEIQASFCISAVRKDTAPSHSESRNPAKGYIRSVVQRMNETSYFPMTDVVVPARDAREGYTAHTFLDNSNGIFYLAPTVAPVDYVHELEQYLLSNKNDGPYLEHPWGAFKYYADRGLHQLVEEPKYMGSRGQLLVFRDPDVARSFGFELPIIMNARSGGRFFRDESEVMPIWQDVAPKMKDDFVILDGEVMPWKLKAERLIARDFTLPGDAALLWRRRYEPDLVHNTEEYMKMVRLYGADGPLEIRAFHLLAKGKVKRGKYRMHFDDTRYGFYRTHEEQLRDIAELEGDVVKPARHKIVQLDSELSKQASIERWLDYCAQGGEGFVYKPMTFFTQSETGYPLQPALKVRGRDYLRIIYGMDYLRPEYFDRLKQRGTKMKRLLAAQEGEISMHILRTFINGNETERLRAVGAFLGLELAQATTIDRTL